MYVPAGDGGKQAVRAVERKVISSVASPVVVGHKKAFVDLAVYLWTDDLTVGGL